MMTPLSKNNLKRLAVYRLQKNCDNDNVFVVEGVRLCREALSSGFTIKTICATDSFYQAVVTSSQCQDIECFSVTDEQLDRLSSMRSPNKVWMLLERPFSQLRNPASSATSSKLVLALDCLQDPGNMGTILRTADWFGIRQLVCSPDTVSCFNPKVVQSSMGAIFRTDVHYCDLTEYLEQSANNGIPIYGAMLDGDNLYDTQLQTPAILVIGNEGNGISPHVAEMLHHRLTIPNIGGTAESLNAAVATAILINEFYR